MDVTLCHCVRGSQHFEGVQCLHLQKTKRILPRHHITEDLIPTIAHYRGIFKISFCRTSDS